LLELATVAGNPGRIDWGDVPTWVGAITTILAFAAAVVAAKIARDLYRVESKRDQRAEDDRAAAAEDRRLAAEDRRRAEEDRLARIESERRAQADKIAAWFTLAQTDEFEQGVPGAFVRNASDLPVFDIMPDFVKAYMGEPSPNAMNTFCGGINVLPPHETKFVELDVSDDNEFHDAGEHLKDSMYMVEIEFRDAAGIRWRRNADGSLTEVRPWRQRTTPSVLQ
jgi:hypothetical protein